MSVSNWTIPQSFDVAAALEIGDRAKIILAGMLPGCTARRYDFPPETYYHWGVELCFVDHGPISPQLWLDYDKYYSIVSLNLHYISMLKDASDHGITFRFEIIPGYARLETGAEAIAAKLYEEISKVDLAGMIAAGAIERIFTDDRSPDPWQGFYLAQCAIYSTRYDEARGLLEVSLKYSKEQDDVGYRDLINLDEAYLGKLDADPEALRRQLNVVVDYNWSHLKVIGAAPKL